MYYVSKRMEIAGAHHLDLPYDSKCENLHGHNWVITVYCKSENLTEYGMVVDFAQIKKEVHNKLDHACINDIIRPLNPTAENIAKWVCKRVSEICECGKCYKVEVQESSGNCAIYVDEDEEV